MPKPECCDSTVFYCLAYGLPRCTEDLRALWDAEEIGFASHLFSGNTSNPSE